MNRQTAPAPAMPEPNHGWWTRLTQFSIIRILLALIAAAFVTTRRLWFVIGAHFGWNFMEGGIFGAAVSGNARRGLLKGTVTGPTYLSGGAFGVESSVVAIAVCLLVALLLLFRARAKGAVIAPFWRRARSD